MDKREWLLHTMTAWVRSGTAHNVDFNVGIEALSKAYDAICAASPETPQEGAWVEHDGDVSKAPSPEQRIEVTYRDGRQSGGYGEDYAWDHDGQYEDIVRWRYA